MVAPGFLENPEVRRWLNGVEPAWTMLEFGSFNALHHGPSASNQAIRLEPGLTPTDLPGSAVTRNAVILLRRAIETGGLKLTQKGNLSRAVVAEMFEIMEWPGLDKEGAFHPPRPTIGWMGKPWLAFARCRSPGCSGQIGISAPTLWRAAFSDPWCGSGCWNKADGRLGRTKPVYTGRRRCSISS